MEDSTQIIMYNFDHLIPIAEEQPYPLLFASVSGAHLYGFPSKDSDYDLRGVHILPTSDVVGLYHPKEVIRVDETIDGIEIDLVTHELTMFFKMLLKRDGNVLEQVYSPLVIHTTPEHDELKEIAKGCITKFHAFHYLGFAQAQWKLFNHDNPQRVKPLLYVYRVLLTGIYLMQTGTIEPNLAQLNEHFNLAYIPDLIERKISGGEQGTLNEADTHFHIAEYNRLRDMLESAHNATDLPDNPTCKAELNDLLLRIRGII